MSYDFVGEQIDCPLCGSSDNDLLSDIGRDGPLRTVICNDCGLVFSNPMPTQLELDEFYSTKYRTEYKKTIEPKLKHTYRNGLRALERISRLKNMGIQPGATCLDVGAGSGEFLYLARRHGYQVHGIEPNQGYANFCREKLLLPVEIGTINEVQIRPSYYDVITLNHVLEHLRDPVASLQKISSWLKPNGKLIVEVPNADAVYHSPGTQYHFAHIYNFSTQTLSLTANKAGLKVVDLQEVPTTKHLNVVLVQTSDRMMFDVDHSDAYRLKKRILDHTKIKHYLSHWPYRRLLSNIMRPLIEKNALRNLNSASQVLDLLYTRSGN